MMLRRLGLSQAPRRCMSVITSTGGSAPGSKLVFSATPYQSIGSDIQSINSRLENLSLMGAYLSGKPLLEMPSDPSSNKPKVCPTTQASEVKRFIVEKPLAVKDPNADKKTISDPLKQNIVKKHAIRMLVLRHKKMKKHQLKRLWDRMYLRFRAKRIRLEKNKELEFRGRLSVKVADARRFDAEKYVDEYLTDYHTPLIPKTYQGKRLPEWLIKELMESDRLHEKEELLRGKEVTKGEEIVKDGETVQQFISRKGIK